MKRCTLFILTLLVLIPTLPASIALSDDWIPLFDGKSLDGWQASENHDTWSVKDGCLVASGPRSHLFYEGPVADHDFKNFELTADVMTQPNSNSGIFFHTQYQETGFPDQGYEVQVNNTYKGTGNYKELKMTGSLYAVRNMYKSAKPDNEWCTMRIRVVGPRIRIWVDDIPTVDYTEPENASRAANRQHRRISQGTFALQGHDPNSKVAFRNIKVKLLPDDLSEPNANAPSKEYTDRLDKIAADYTPLIDYHVHMRDGMTPEEALKMQLGTGICRGILKNIGRDWPVKTNDELKAFLDETEGLPMFVGVQVNDRDWMDQFDPKLLERVDYVLGDTMIMTDDQGNEVRLWIDEQVKIDDPEKWMDKYVEHNLKVLSEPITILANPTYLPNALKDRYDTLWTNERMQKVIDAAVKNKVALEINAQSGFPSDRFIQLAKQSGARFTLGSNNKGSADWIDMSRCIEAVEKNGLKKQHMYVPGK